MNDHYAQRAKEVLKTIEYATIATTGKDGKPWNSPIAHAWDDARNIYWFSDENSRHSQNIRENEDVAIVIYDSTSPFGEGRGVYIEAKAYELADRDEIMKGCRLKRGAGFDGSPDDFLGDANRRVYKAVPQRVWMNDAEEKDGVFIRDYRVEVPLLELRSL